MAERGGVSHFLDAIIVPAHRRAAGVCKRKKGADANVSVEIYDMGSAVNAFGIYGAERFPENVFLPVGTQGYLEDDVLNFLVGRYYVKLMCFDCGDGAESALNQMAASIVGLVKDRGGFPQVLRHFPEKGKVANSEKFSLKNVMGYAFLSHGYLSSYMVDGMEFDCFIIKGESEEHASQMLDKYLEKKSAQPMEKLGAAVKISDRYYDNIYISRSGVYLYGVMKIKEGRESTGEAFLEEMKNSLSKG